MTAFLSATAMTGVRSWASPRLEGGQAPPGSEQGLVMCSHPVRGEPRCGEAHSQGPKAQREGTLPSAFTEPAAWVTAIVSTSGRTTTLRSDPLQEPGPTPRGRALKPRDTLTCTGSHRPVQVPVCTLPACFWSEVPCDKGQGQRAAEMPLRVPMQGFLFSQSTAHSRHRCLSPARPASRFGSVTQTETKKVTAGVYRRHKERQNVQQSGRLGPNRSWH